MRPCPRTDDLDFDAATDVHAFDHYADAIASLLKDEQFAQLDCIANSVRSTQARFSGGSLKLVKFYNGVDEPRPGHPTEEDWQNHLRRVEHWVTSSPESISARIALAKSSAAKSPYPCMAKPKGPPGRRPQYLHA